MRYTLPQPYEDLGHTADLGVAVTGATAAEALARLLLALGDLLRGDGEAPPVVEAPIEARGADWTGTALAALREALFRFATERLIPVSCEPISVGPERAILSVGWARHDPALHAEGADIKAVTYHAARFEQLGDQWKAQVIFDI
jgi:SHS2 domain-containing protein